MLIPFDRLRADHGIKANGVLHLGANTGQEAAAYAAWGVPQVVWVEAIPEVCAKLKANVAKFPGSVVLCACVSDADHQKITFNVSNNDEQSSSILQFGTHAKEHPGVVFVRKFQTETVRVDTLLAQHQVKLGTGWFLNIDLQGAELMALKGMGDLLLNFDYAYVEVNVNELYKGCPLVADIDAYLSKYGLEGRETAMTASGWGDKFYARKL